jgi:hypothetical protein
VTQGREAAELAGRNRGRFAKEQPEGFAQAIPVASHVSQWCKGRLHVFHECACSFLDGMARLLCIEYQLLGGATLSA